MNKLEFQVKSIPSKDEAHETSVLKVEFVDCNNYEPSIEIIQENTYKCIPCFLNYENEELLFDHYKWCPYKTNKLAVLDSQEDIFTCAFCNLQILGEIYYQRHEKVCRRREISEESCAEKSGTELLCNKCSYTTKSRSRLKQHAIVHSDQRQFKCEDCDKTFKYNRNLTEHIRVQHSNGKKKFKCSYCDARYNYKAKLMYHMNVKHLNQKDYQCDICGYATADKNVLKVHTARKHGQVEKKHKCKACEYSTHRRAYLTIHMRIHTKEKPYKCKYPNCNYKSAQRNTLARHIKCRHMEEKPFKCSECNYETADRTALIRHFRVKHN